MPWWERISVTLDDKGNQQSCNYQSSLSPKGPEACGKEMASTMPSIRAMGGPGVYSKLTFERRFSPGAKLDSGRLHAPEVRTSKAASAGRRTCFMGRGSSS